MFASKIKAIAPVMDKFRVSLDGLRDSHDRMRQSGSFDSAIEMIDLARTLGVIPPCHADVRQPVYQGILFLDGPEENTSA